METVLYCYEFSPDNFVLLDANTGYYVSYKSVPLLSITKITDVMAEHLSRGIELRFTPSIKNIAQVVSGSTLNFSLIRMRNAV